MKTCNVCGAATTPVLALDGPYSLTSLGRRVEASAEVSVCERCSHAQTATSIDLAQYYASEYKTLAASAEEDDLYEIRNGQPVYRNQYMAAVLTGKLPGLKGAVLDFGCGKSLVMKHYGLTTDHRDVHLFDVSRDYTRFWDLFVPQERYACFEVPASWRGKFALVTSFFSMEHVPDPLAELRTIRRLLTADGVLYLVVPNMYQANTADMIVVDHVQHYSEASMKRLLGLAGFSLTEADHLSHKQGSIYLAAPSSIVDDFSEEDQAQAQLWVARCKAISTLWSRINHSVRQFEEALIQRGVERYFIVGAGIVGTYLFGQLQHRERLAGFIDSNTFKQSKGWHGMTVFAPGTISADARTGIFSGLNTEQVETVLPQLLPRSGFDQNVWTMKAVDLA
jgi:SAM-dependent methyltransferase